MTYFEKLQTPEWLNKRKLILARDHNVCQRCGIKYNEVPKHLGCTYKELVEEHGMTFSESYLVNNIPTLNLYFGHNFIKTKIIATGPEYFVNKLEEYVLIMYGYEKAPEFEKIFDNSSFSINSQVKWNSMVSSEIIEYFKKAVLNSGDRIDFLFDFELTYSSPKAQIRDIAKLDFHVHHKCYRKDFEPWEQNDTDYVTLCNICHRSIHESSLIPYYDGNNNIIQLLTPCSKCNGLRHIECYRHVDHGRCFKCNGSGFEPFKHSYPIQIT